MATKQSKKKIRPSQRRALTLRRAKRKTPPHYTGDAKFSWVVPEFGEKGRDWAELATAYMAYRAQIPGGSYAARLHGISRIIRTYIAKHGYWDPRTIIVTGPNILLPPLRGEKGKTPFRQNSGGIAHSNRLSEFMDWVIEHDPQGRFGAWEDGQFTRLPGCVNPFPKAGYSGIPRRRESVYLPLPFKMIVELREKLAPGLHFSDWHFAQQQPQKHGGTQSGDWFEVKDPKVRAMIDLKAGDPGYDADLVLRRRQAPTYSANGFRIEKWDPRRKNSFPVYRDIIEAWSPVRALLILAKLEICVRTFQLRVLDSGEVDSERIELVDQIVEGRPEPTFRWVANTQRDRLLDRLPVEERRKLTSNRGVFRPYEDPYSDERLTGLFFNTNKTGDIGKDPMDRGYFVPWEHKSLLRWLIKLRNWQEKYNPLRRPALWTETSARHLGQAASPALLKILPPTCFLFRDASALNVPTIAASELRWTPADSKLPITKQSATKLWGRLLLSYEQDLAQKGELAGGKPIRLIRKIHEGSDTVSTKHPLHSLRVSLLSALACDGKVPLEILMKLAGHRALAMTLTYTKANAILTNEELQRAIAAMNRDKDENYAKWLAEFSREEIAAKMVVLDDDAFKYLVSSDPTERLPHTWVRVHDGFCLAGGNTSPPVNTTYPLPGCYNGGKVIPGMSGTRSINLHDPVPPRHCAECRCRWLVSGPAFLPELQAKFAIKSRSLSELELLRAETAKKVEQLKDARYDATKGGRPFDRRELDQTTMLLQRQEADAVRAAAELGNVAYVAQRCVDVLAQEKKSSEETQQLVAFGTADDVHLAIRTIDLEVVALSGLCLDAEIYPELEGEATAAIYRRSQLLDRLLTREPGHIPLITFDKKLQLEIGNRYVQSMALAQEAELKSAKENVPVGHRAVLELALTVADKAANTGRGLPVYLRKAIETVRQDRANLPGAKLKTLPA